ncbi:hypothetical protein CAY57_14395 [Heyndrickxia coagulans]|nr:hypothetical protein CAY57_14395 [Heyndrickxia coagulans]
MPLTGYVNETKRIVYNIANSQKKFNRFHKRKYIQISSSILIPFLKGGLFAGKWNGFRFSASVE